MKRIFDGEVYEMILQNGGIVFSYCKKSNENSVCVFYKMLSAETGEVHSVARNIYLLAKFGVNYRASSELCSNYVKARTVEFPSGILCVVADTGNTYLIDSSGLPIWSGDINYNGEQPSDIAVYNGSLWACYLKAGVLLRFNISTMREELRIGGKNSPFDKPCDIFINENIAVISNSGSNKLSYVNLDTYEVNDGEEFSESVYSYLELKDNKYVLLESGLYLI